MLIHCFLSVPFKVNSKAAESLADPAEYPNLFEDWEIALSVEATVAPKRYLFAINGLYSSNQCIKISHPSMM